MWKITQERDKLSKEFEKIEELILSGEVNSKDAVERQEEIMEYLMRKVIRIINKEEEWNK